MLFSEFRAKRQRSKAVQLVSCRPDCFQISEKSPSANLSRGFFHSGAGGNTALLELASDRSASCAFPGRPADAALNCQDSRMSRGFGAAGLLFRIRVVDYTSDSYRGRTIQTIRTFTIHP